MTTAKPVSAEEWLLGCTMILSRHFHIAQVANQPLLILQYATRGISETS